jgi:tRNA A-37 threonylcarbamoyl transferase component Bud32
VGSSGRSVEPFSVPGFTGQLAIACRPRDLAAALARLTDPANAEETLHWGRNYLYTTRLETTAGDCEVVVKQFRNQTVVQRLRRRLGGSKAERSWRAALAFATAGIPTPEPVIWVESQDPAGPSFFVSRRLEGFFETRYFLRARNASREADEFPQVGVDAFFDRLGGQLRRMHDAGIWHRDVSIGNLLVRLEDAQPVFFLIDLNRARLGRRLGALRRSRDLCRLRILRREDRRRLLDAYWGEGGAPAWKQAIYGTAFHGFLFKNRLKEALRAPLRIARGARPARQPHAHIPAAAADAGVRDRVVWDRLSDQPHQHAGRLERLAVRMADAGDHARSVTAALAAAPRIWRRYRRLAADRHREPRPWTGIGLALRPYEEDTEGLLEAVEELGVGPLLLRLHPWQQDHRAEERLAARLAAAGHELTFALPQNRDLVRDPQRWRAAVEELAARFRPFGRRFQVGQAINRSKWGVWKYGEYLELAVQASEILRRHPDTEVLGPAVIDFEPHATAAVLNRRRPAVHFDAVASLLYVDRRGAPENRQLGLDTTGKVTLLHAIAETARNSAGRTWITEVNWPLWEGPHSPAGRDVAVDEQTQADYLARYYLLTLGTGLVERVYWWQLAARGYGLLDPGAEGLRRRPAFHAMRTLVRELEGSLCLGPLPASSPARLLGFRRADGAELVAAWATDGPTQAELPRAATAVMSRDGERLAATGRNVLLGGSPLLMRLEPGAVDAAGLSNSGPPAT